MVIDSAGGEKDARLDPLNYFNFTCNFLCFVSGPIQRSDEYVAQLAHISRNVDETLAFAAFHRLIKGFIKLAVVSAVANYLFAALSTPLLAESTSVAGWRFAGQYAASAVAYTFYLYYNFSGYMDIVIGIGWLSGRLGILHHDDAGVLAVLVVKFALPLALFEGATRTSPAPRSTFAVGTSASRST